MTYDDIGFISFMTAGNSLVCVGKMQPEKYFRYFAFCSYLILGQGKDGVHITSGNFQRVAKTRIGGSTVIIVGDTTSTGWLPTTAEVRSTQGGSGLQKGLAYHQPHARSGPWCKSLPWDSFSKITTGCRNFLQELIDQDYYDTMCHDLEFQESSRKFCRTLFQEFAVDLTFEDNIALQVNAEILHYLSNSSLITSLEMITNKREVLNKLAKHKPIRLWV